MIREHVHKIDRPRERRLVIINHKTVNRYNDIVKEQIGIHKIKEQLNAVDNHTRICGRPGLKRLASIIIKLCKQMDEIQIHGENKCRKMMTPVSDFSQQIQHWYDSIHVYLAPLCLKDLDRKCSNPSNTYQFARNCNIEEPKKLTEKDLKDALCYCKIRQEVR